MKILIVTIYLVILLGEGKNKFYKIKHIHNKKKSLFEASYLYPCSSIPENNLCNFNNVFVKS